MIKNLRSKKYFRVLLGILGISVVYIFVWFSLVRTHVNTLNNTLNDYAGISIEDNLTNDSSLLNNAIDDLVDVVNLPETVEASIEDMMMPANGSISNDFGWQKDGVTGFWNFNPGVTFTSEDSIAVSAALFGKVESITFDTEDNSYEVVIKHTEELETIYKCLTSVLVKEEEEVSTGDLIGESIGASGSFFIFEIFENGEAVSPTSVFKG